MTDKEYQDKRRECWDEYKRTNLDGEVQWQPVSRYDVFCAAFDRAYALGKETISQEEIEKAALEYSERLGKNRDLTWNDAEYGFITGAQFALGKQENDADTVIQGWVARDKGRFLGLYPWQPKRGDMAWLCGSCLALPINTFPDLTWESDPEEVEIIIKRKKDG